jgi:predicted transposase YbfD/YdcC
LSKKTVRQIISTGNHYIIQVKGNQKNLFKQLKLNTADEKTCIDSAECQTKARGRIEIRKTLIYNDIQGVSPDWVGLKRLIRVERTVITKAKTSHQTAYYISSICKNRAMFFAEHIRNHWGIENRLHWVKDVCMNEDKSKTISGMAAENFSILRNIVINLFRTNGYNSIKYATEICNNNLKQLIRLTQCKSMNYKIT